MIVRQSEGLSQTEEETEIWLEIAEIGVMSGGLIQEKEIAIEAPHGLEKLDEVVHLAEEEIVVVGAGNELVVVAEVVVQTVLLPGAGRGQRLHHHGAEALIDAEEAVAVVAEVIVAVAVQAAVDRQVAGQRPCHRLNEEQERHRRPHLPHRHRPEPLRGLHPLHDQDPGHR